MFSKSCRKDPAKEDRACHCAVCAMSARCLRGLRDVCAVTELYSVMPHLMRHLSRSRFECAVIEKVHAVTLIRHRAIYARSPLFGFDLDN